MLGELYGRTGTATARAVESSDTMKTVIFRARNESQKDSGFFEIPVPPVSSDSDSRG
jgi:hypothetical protein